MELAEAGSLLGCRFGVELELDGVVELLGPSRIVSKDRVAVTGCKFCNGCGFLREALGVCATNNDSFRMNPSGIRSVKTGVGGNSTAGGGDVMENDWEKALDAIETGDPNKAIDSLAWGVELMLLVPSVCCRRSAMRAINWTSMGFLGA
jgi:hypothetical protein